MTGLFSYPKRKLRKLINEGEYEQAIELGNDLEEKFSDDPDFLFIMGSMYYILTVSYTHLTLPTIYSV